MGIKKSVLIFLIIISLFLVILINAEETDPIKKAYDCFEKGLGDDCGGVKSVKELSLNLIASSYSSNFQSDCKTALKNKLKENCWPETDTGSCSIKSTAFAILALNHINEETEDYVKWLVSKKKVNTGLIWYLEIDADNKTECDINGKTITLEENKKISGSLPTGLTKAYNGYWLQINDIEKNYTISCKKNFVTALLFQKSGSEIFHVSSETHFGSETGVVTEKVNSYCLTVSNTCDYEGTLLSAIVLAKLGEDTTTYIPYLIAMEDQTENKKYLPSSFLYILTNSDYYFNELINSQKNNNYWDESRNKFYDTALALLALQQINSDASENAKKYLFSVQGEDGCWPSDTAFILHAGWAKDTAISGTEGKTSISYCEDFQHFCVSIGQCGLEDTLSENFYCSSSSQICCEKEFNEKTCEEKEGLICKSQEICDGESISASDSYDCCRGECIAAQTGNECEEGGNSCQSSCNEDTEEEVKSLSDSCDLGEICCKTKEQVAETKSNWLSIALLIVLIILVILAIIFRNQLKIWLFKRKIETNKTGKPFSRPSGFQPPSILQVPPSIFRRPFQQRQIPKRPPLKSSEKDKEFEETMKKLRDMSK